MKRNGCWRVARVLSFVSLGIVLCAYSPEDAAAQAIFTNGIDVCSNHVQGVGLIDMVGWAKGYGDPDVRGLAVSIGQLGGKNPVTGADIDNPTNLIALVPASVMTDEIQAQTTNGLALFDYDGRRALHVADGAIHGNALGLTNLQASSIGGTLSTAVVLSAASVGSVQLQAGAVTAEKLANEAVGTNKAAMGEWSAWGDARYVNSAGYGDLVLSPGRWISGANVYIDDIAADAYGARRSGANHHDGHEFIGARSHGAEQIGYVGDSGCRVIGADAYGAEQRGSTGEEDYQSIGNYSYGAEQRGATSGSTTIGAYCYGADQRGRNYNFQSIANYGYGAEQRGRNDSTQSIDVGSYGAEQRGYNGGAQTMGVYAYGAEQRGRNFGTQTVGDSAAGAEQRGNNQGIQVIGVAAHGASQRGYVSSSSSATNSGVGSIQLLNLQTSQHARVTGSASMGLGACMVTNDQAIVAGDGLASRGKGTVVAVGFYGNGAGLFVPQQGDIGMGTFTNGAAGM